MTEASHLLSNLANKEQIRYASIQSEHTALSDYSHGHYEFAYLGYGLSKLFVFNNRPISHI